MPNNIDGQITFICFSICLNMHKYAHVIYSIYNTILKNSKVDRQTYKITLNKY